jgi:hypothetical protein
MKSLLKVRMTAGFVFFLLVLCFSFMVLDDVRAQSFTYTAPVTQKSAVIGDTTEFSSTLTNTGSSGDTYDVDMIEMLATPDDWWIRFCVGGVCYPPEVTHAEVPLGASEAEEIELHMLPNSPGIGKVIMRVTSQANPSLKDSITFILNTAPGVPVVSLHGIIALVLLITASGFYLLWRRLNLAKAK